MKTLEEIKNEIAQEIGYESAENYLSELYEIGGFYTLDRITLFINEVAIRTSREALKNASENAETICGNSEKDKKGIPTGYCGSWCGGCENLIVDQQSILNESNIPKL